MSSSKEQKRGEEESVATVVAVLSLSVGPKRAYRSIPYSRSLIKNGSLPLASLSLSISQVFLV